MMSVALRPNMDAVGMRDRACSEPADEQMPSGAVSSSARYSPAGVAEMSATSGAGASPRACFGVTAASPRPSAWARTSARASMTVTSLTPSARATRPAYSPTLAVNRWRFDCAPTTIIRGG